MIKILISVTDVIDCLWHFFRLHIVSISKLQMTFTSYIRLIFTDIHWLSVYFTLWANHIDTFIVLTFRIYFRHYAAKTIALLVLIENKILEIPSTVEHLENTVISWKIEFIKLRAIQISVVFINRTHGRLSKKRCISKNQLSDLISGFDSWGR